MKLQLKTASEHGRDAGCLQVCRGRDGGPGLAEEQILNLIK